MNIYCLDSLESSSVPVEIDVASTSQPILQTAITESTDDKKAIFKLDISQTTLEPTEETPQYNL